MMMMARGKRNLFFLLLLSVCGVCAGWGGGKQDVEAGELCVCCVC